jgi:hypothetical protein
MKPKCGILLFLILNLKVAAWKKEQYFLEFPHHKAKH